MSMKRISAGLLLLSGALALGLGAASAQAMPFLREAASRYDTRFLLEASDTADARLLLASAATEGASQGVSTEKGGRSQGRGPGQRSGRAEAAGKAPTAAARAEADSDPAGDQTTASTSAAAGVAAGSGDDDGAPGATGSTGTVGAESGASAGVATGSGIEASAESGASAGVTHDEDGASITAAAFADSGVTTASDDEVVASTRSKTKEIDTKFGAIGMARSMTHATTEDGTKVLSRSWSRSMALDTPGITKADARSRADVRVVDGSAGDSAAVPGVDEVEGSAVGTASPAISEANAN